MASSWCRWAARPTSGTSFGLFGPQGFGVRLAGLCDEGEERDFRRNLEQAGLGAGLDRAGLAELGFFVCVADLEDELIRSLGVRRVEQLIEAQGELGPFRTFTRQPAQRNRTREQQLRRFMGTRSGRKIHYGHVLAAALDLTRLPSPLARRTVPDVSRRPAVPAPPARPPGCPRPWLATPHPGLPGALLARVAFCRTIAGSFRLCPRSQ